MKAVLCYNDNEDEELRTKIRITIPKNWKGIAVPKVRNLLQEFITPYNAHFKNRNILSVDNVYLAVHKDDLVPKDGAFRRESLSQNNDSFDSIDAGYLPLDLDAPITSCIRNNTTVYVLHKIKSTLIIIPKSSGNKPKSTTDSTANDRRSDTDGESYQNLHSSYSSESLSSLRHHGDDSQNGSVLAEEEKCSNLSIVKIGGNDQPRQRLSLFAAVVSKGRDCDGSVSSIPSRLGWMNRNGNKDKDKDKDRDATKRLPLKSDMSAASFNTDRSNLYVHNLFRKLKKQSSLKNAAAAAAASSLDANAPVVSNNSKFNDERNQPGFLVEPYLQSHQALTRTESMKKRVSFGKDLFAIETIKEVSPRDDSPPSSFDNDDEEPVLTSPPKSHQMAASLLIQSTENNSTRRSGYDPQMNMLMISEEGDLEDVFSCGEDYVAVTPGLQQGADLRSSNEENECRDDTSSMTSELGYLTRLLETMENHDSPKQLVSADDKAFHDQVVVDSGRKTETSSISKSRARESPSIAGLSKSFTDGGDDDGDVTCNNDLDDLRCTMIRLGIMPDSKLFDMVANDMLFHHHTQINRIDQSIEKQAYDVVAVDMKERINAAIIKMLSEYHNEALARDKGVQTNSNSSTNMDTSAATSTEELVKVNPHFYDQSLHNLRYFEESQKHRSSSSFKKSHDVQTRKQVVRRRSLSSSELNNSNRLQPQPKLQSIQFRGSDAIVPASQSVFQTLFCSAH
jgi:hypothetical protein